MRMKVIREVIENRRILLGLSIDELTRKAGIRRKTYDDIEFGWIPFTTQFIRICKVLGLSIDDFIEEE